jgi:hypothetical protein
LKKENDNEAASFGCTICEKRNVVKIISFICNSKYTKQVILFPFKFLFAARRYGKTFWGLLCDS